jgi:hypothetical protein
LSADNTRTTNGSVLRTCAIRPTGMFGEKDSHHLPNVLAGNLVFTFTLTITVNHQTYCPSMLAGKTGITMRMGDGKARFVHAYAGTFLFCLCGSLECNATISTIVAFGFIPLIIHDQ